MSLRCNEKQIPDRGRTAGGVRGIEMRDPKTKLLTDKVVGVDVVSATSQLLVVSEKGFGKRTDLSRYSDQKRGGRGPYHDERHEQDGADCGRRRCGTR